MAVARSQPMRVLHVVTGAERFPVLHGASLGDAGGAGEACIAACAACVRASSDARHDVVVLGTSSDGRLASTLGIHGSWRVSPGLLGRSGRALRMCVDRMARPGVIMAWGKAATDLVREHLSGVAPVVSANLDRGVLVDHAGQESGLHPSLPDDSRDERAGLRRSLRLDDDDVTLGLLDDPANRGDCVGFMFIAGVLRVAGIRVAAVFNRRTHGFETAMRHVREIGYVSRVIATDMSLTRIARCADICIAGSRQDAALREPRFPEIVHATIAAHAGVPTILPRVATLEKMNYPALLMARASRPTEFARRLVPLLTIKDALRSAGEAAKAWAATSGFMHEQIRCACQAACGASSGAVHAAGAGR